MNFKEFYFDEEDEAEMFEFVAQHWDFIFNVQFRGKGAEDYHMGRGWTVRVKFDNGNINKK